MMPSNLFWLRLSYWVAAIADFVVAVLVLIPERMGLAGYAYPMGLMAAVAFSWGVLLVVADRKPLERRWVLPPTMLVVALLGVAGAHAGYAGLIPASRSIGTVAASVGIVAVAALGYRKTRP